MDADSAPLAFGPEPTWTAKVLRLHEAMKQRGIPFAFGGAIALNYHREPRSTLDIDINIFLSPEQRSGVLDALGSLYGLPDRQRLERQLGEEGQTRSRWGHTYVDLFFANSEFHQSMARRAVREPFADAAIPVLSIEDLLVCKVLFDRPRDWVDIEAVAETRRGQLDTAYIEYWVDAFVERDDARFGKLRGVLRQDQ
jgi:hypothetical protein